jgi:hypothetical protein
MPIERQQLQMWKHDAEEVLKHADTALAVNLAREAIPRLIDEVVRLSAGSERDRIAALMAQGLVAGQVASGRELTMVPAAVADKAYVLADALLAKRDGM